MSITSTQPAHSTHADCLISLTLHTTFQYRFCTGRIASDLTLTVTLTYTGQSPNLTITHGGPIQFDAIIRQTNVTYIAQLLTILLIQGKYSQTAGKKILRYILLFHVCHVVQ